jgi:hypothetical protein
MFSFASSHADSCQKDLEVIKDRLRIHLGGLIEAELEFGLQFGVKEATSLAVGQVGGKVLAGDYYAE